MSSISGDYINDDFDAGPVYPEVFGVEMTPQILGALAAVAGVALAGFAFVRFVLPVYQTNQTIRADINDKNSQLASQAEQIAAAEQANAELEQALEQRRTVYSLFASESTMDTLLLDLNQRVKSSNAALGSVRNQVSSRGIPPLLLEAQLQNFSPEGETVISDGSLGDGVNGKLKRDTYTIEFRGDFAQTEAILRNIERLEPLLLFREFTIESEEPIAETVIGANGQVVAQPKIPIVTSFQIDALIPTTAPDELPTIAPPPDPAAPVDGAVPAEGG
ncbi:hypothetical protein IQ241_08805 [Romeria aff. gracilis LEGE 07310]|uniref:Type IV pilus assembly protein PilO n=1 Tax=Vasconcelosia minhoensis LEGE 07310 TaxID=915328 RepID=A0A8J7A7A6_9CYAN|nr:hypothetical protein [Romeria gracilis]MBE9077395.1 hypothetical protein [Romeria aff. gracilis LEGE 07310]